MITLIARAVIVVAVCLTAIACIRHFSFWELLLAGVVFLVLSKGGVQWLRDYLGKDFPPS